MGSVVFFYGGWVFLAGAWREIQGRLPGMMTLISIAIGAGTNVAIESAGIILMRNNPRDIVKIIRLSRATFLKMIQNLFWATGYNVIALPLAAGALVFRGKEKSAIITV